MFGERLKILRNEQKLLQKELAKAMKVSPSTIGMYERGQRDPDTNTLIFLSKFFDVSVDYLLGRTDDRNAAVLEGNEIPKELREIGVEYLEILKEYKEKGFTPEDLKKLIDIMSK